jgi:hypothetical protein
VQRPCHPTGDETRTFLAEDDPTIRDLLPRSVARWRPVSTSIEDSRVSVAIGGEWSSARPSRGGSRPLLAVARLVALAEETLLRREALLPRVLRAREDRSRSRRRPGCPACPRS